MRLSSWGANKTRLPPASSGELKRYPPYSSSPLGMAAPGKARWGVRDGNTRKGGSLWGQGRGGERLGLSRAGPPVTGVKKGDFHTPPLRSPPDGVLFSRPYGGTLSPRPQILLLSPWANFPSENLTIKVHIADSCESELGV